MYNSSFDFKPIAFLIVVGMIAIFFVGINISTAVDPVRAAEAAYQNAQTDIYVSKQSLELQRQQDQLAHEQQMREIQAQYEPVRIQAEIEQKFITARTISTISTIVAVSIGLAFVILAAGWTILRLTTARARSPVPIMTQTDLERQLYQRIRKMNQRIQTLEQIQHTAIPIDPEQLYPTRQRERSRR